MNGAPLLLYYHNPGANRLPYAGVSPVIYAGWNP
jgi:hypothetical protein